VVLSHRLPTISYMETSCILFHARFTPEEGVESNLKKI